MLRRRDLVVLGGMSAAGLGLLGRLVFGGPRPLCADDVVCQERQAQRDLPHSADPIWAVLKRCRVSLDKQSGDYSLMPTSEVKGMVGRRVRVGGFVVPLDGSDRTRKFLIGVNTPVCFYHPPGDPNEVIAVDAATPVEWTDRPVMLEGMFTLIDNAQAGVFFKLTDAREV